MDNAHLRSRIEGRHVENDAGCWVWTGPVSGKGYGSVWLGKARRHIHAHRISYIVHVGPVPDGLVIDHLCRNRLCVNPGHLEAVTNKENILRGMSMPARNARKTHCKWGHELTPENVIRKNGHERACRTCHLRYARELRARRKAQKSELRALATQTKKEGEG